MNRFGRAMAPIMRKAFGLDQAFLSGAELPKVGNLFAGDSAAAYQSSALCYACIRRKAVDVSGVPLVFLRDPNDADSEITDPNHSIVRLMRKPHPTLSTEQFLQFFVTLLEMRGEEFVVFDNPIRPTVAVPYYDPLGWRDVVGPKGDLLYWNVRAGDGRSFDVFDRDILRHRYIAPTKPFRGQSPLQAATDPYTIETTGDRYTARLIQRGGESGNVYTTDQEVAPKLREAILAAIRSRRGSNGEPLRDILLGNGVKPADPAFTRNDLDMIALQGPAKEKLCAAFGLTPSLIIHDDAPNYATFRERLKIYWTQTLIPLVRGIESAFDRFFVEGQTTDKAYIRFDLSKVEALQEELTKKLESARTLYSMNVPMTVINERLGLRLNVEDIPGAGEVFLPVTMAPLSLLLEDFHSDNSDNTKSGGAGKKGSGSPLSPDPSGAVRDLARSIVEGFGRQRASLTRAAAIERATNPRNTVARERRLEAMRRDLRNDWRLMVGKHKEKFAAAVNEQNIDDAAKINAAFERLFDPMRDDFHKTIEPFHTKAAREGLAWILEIIEDDPAKSHDIAAIVHRADLTLGDETLFQIRQRTKFIEDMSWRLFEAMQDDVMGAVAEGNTLDQVRRLVKHNFNVSINRSATIARTEVGTGYSIGRFYEMKRAGYDKHEWLTAHDEDVRGGTEDEFNHKECEGVVRDVGKKFPCGLSFPMENGGQPGNVINCRCFTIPVVD